MGSYTLKDGLTARFTANIQIHSPVDKLSGNGQDEKGKLFDITGKVQKPTNAGESTTFEIELKFKDSETKIHDSIDLSSIRSKSKEQMISLTAVDHYTHCELLYFIGRPDIRFVNHGTKIYIHANLHANLAAEEGRNGDGYVETRM